LVRLEGDVPQGNHQLVKLGAIPFPPEPWNRSILNLLDEAEQLHRIEAQKNTSKQLDLSEIKQSELRSNSINHQDKESTPKLPKDAYEAVLPLLLHHLSEPKVDKEVAGLLDVGIGQVRIWLKKAMQENLVEKKKTKYVLNQDNKQLHLLKSN
jgi:predicted Rossmann fold nucleotide-binding protein DprA/Smf involved in DNA uptake